MFCCARCGRQVYHAELRVALNKYWHSFCFSCYKCRKLLDSCSVNTHNGELFCNACYKSVCYDPCFPYKDFRASDSCCNNRPHKLPDNICQKSCNTCKKPCCSSYSACGETENTSQPRSSICSKSCCMRDTSCNPCNTCDSPSKNINTFDERTSCNNKKFMPSSYLCCNTSNPCEVPRATCKTSCNPYEEVICNPPCRPIIVNTRSRHDCCYCPRETLCLQPACPRKKCVPAVLCLEDCEPPTMSRCRSCSPSGSEPKTCRSPCCPARPGSACAAPAPREINNYYSRNHSKCIENNCKGSCYCPEDCCCPHRRMFFRHHTQRNSDPCVIIETCPPKKCWPPKAKGPPPNGCQQNTCCPLNGCQLCPPKSPPELECPPCCMPYQPPPRKAVCYPPIKCCEPPPPERICYYPGDSPPMPKCCPCGSPNPCNCDLNYRRRLAICKNTPCCKRCGSKVYAAERIIAAGNSFHSCCFSCYCCHKPLEVTNVCENQGEIYCRTCYCKFFGIQGYGYGCTLQTPI